MPKKDRLALQNAGRTAALLWELLLFFVLLLAVQLVEGILTGIAAAWWTGETLTLFGLYATLPATAVILLFCRYARGRTPRQVVGPLRRAWEYAVFAPLGVGLFAAAVGICAAVGALRVETAQDLAVGRWLLFLVGFLLQGASEEILCRGYLMGSLLRGWHPWVAVTVNSAAFALLHLSNPSVSPLAICNTFLFGVLMSVIALRRGNLWGACALHSLWNFAQGNLFGIRVSGLSAGPSPFLSVLTPDMPLWNGAQYGLEASLPVTLCLLLAVGAGVGVRPR
ncbi:MAG TPA: hypothetical protein DDW30_08420, partial [Clostridiales bacterium]|nr:hypothetical protein [Clostridiales bacterium]